MTPATVSKFEYNLLRILRFLLGHMPVEQAKGLILTRFIPVPGCLSRTCVNLVRDTLSKGLCLFLVRAGGWRHDRFLVNQEPRFGRLWDRHPLSEHPLQFSRHSLTFLLWLTAEKPTEARAAWEAPPDELSTADLLFLALAYEALRPIDGFVSTLGNKPAFRQNPILWIIRPGDFGWQESAHPPPFKTWFESPRCLILESLQPWLIQQWIRNERAKGQMADWKTLRQQGLAEQAFLDSFLATAEQSSRPDLCRFLLRTASTLLSGPELTHQFWTGGLQGPGSLRLADRLEHQQAALALVRHVETFHRWDRVARSVSYFDDEYASSQYWKAEWEAAKGELITAHARRILDGLQPLRTN